MSLRQLAVHGEVTRPPRPSWRSRAGNYPSARFAALTKRRAFRGARGAALSCALSLFAWLSLASAARAEPLRIDASAERMRVDGALREWRGARFAELGRGDDASLRYALATADNGLYVAAEVRDEQLVTGKDGDALVLALAMPEANGWVASELWLLPGESGRSKASALLGSDKKVKAEPRVQVVEGPLASGTGYVIEAFVPWAVIRGAEIWEQGRGALRFVDVDGKPGKAESILTSATAKRPEDLPRLALGTGQNDMLGSFLAVKRMSGVEPRFDFRANVAGDAQLERVVIVADYLVVYGPGYKQGETFGYFALPYGTGGGLNSAELRDLTGDGRAELMIVVRQQNAKGTREVWLALGLEEGGIAPMFGVELRKELKGGFIESSLSLQTKGQRVPRIDVRVGRAQGLDANTYEEVRAPDAEPLLLPWGAVEQRSYAFDGTRFAVVDEKRKAMAPTAPSTASVESSASGRPKAAEVEAPAAATPEQVLALFKSQQKLPADAKPSRTVRLNLLGGTKAEQIDVFGSVLAITGPEVGEGRGYLTYVVPVSNARDVLDVRPGGIKKDGFEALFVRIRQPLTGVEGVERELVLVLRGDANGRLSRALQIEVARRQGEQAIENRTRVENGALVVEPGTATGWNAQSYPFVPDAVGGAQALLLPWRDRPVRYSLEQQTP